MANIKSNTKTLKKSTKKRTVHKGEKTTLKNQVKQAKTTADKKTVSKVQSTADKLAKKGTISKSKANRTKSKTAKVANKKK
ncbi:30S ribosomal protein S20 [Mycoplasmoides pirum]|uniref:30S ribosomal protein S20 n=1 Tax=Mycoplasmoides pirum TaxID=2122 RepID=UPI00047F305D|nr:30S ribosomal protein S20 [Mycoplasmoides pirum]